MPQLADGYARIRSWLGFLFFTPFLFAQSTFIFAQDEWQNIEQDWLYEVLPMADSFSEKQGTPPVYQAYRSNGASSNELIGYVFTTPDLPPEEVGYSGPIDLLVGMDLSGVITGLKVLYYLESYKHVRGDFIVDSGFPDQFIGKSIADEFRMRVDIDGISRATISSWALARGLRNATRRIAMAYLPGSSFVIEANAEIQALQKLQNQAWEDYLANGFVKEFSAPIAGESSLDFSLAYMGHYRLGELLIGASDYSNSDRTASEMIEDGHMLLLGLGGNTPRLQQMRLAVIQDNVVYPNRGDRVVFAGTAREGKIAGHARFAIAMFMHPEIDINRPFSVVYDTSETRGEFSEHVGVEYQVPPDVLTLITGSPVTEENPMIQILFFVVLLLLGLVLFLLNIPRMKAAFNQSNF
ncbi:MAG: FMN-binding protein [Gammaproteobacteria bacterium]|nr:FMN-binding protein [Gammaproteobacteria bacterium]MDD9896621.1 FMN-binding protein [Gammaproteobacteria bacterium]MDD9958039.1 FMN-binding protein [Gammaproteobacteria bacterium]